MKFTMILPDGTTCTANALTGRPFCFVHAPNRATERADARRRGGQTRKAQLTGAVVPSLKSGAEVRDYLARVCRDTEAALIPPKTATAISNLARTALAAIQRAQDEDDETERKRTLRESEAERKRRG